MRKDKVLFIVSVMFLLCMFIAAIVSACAPPSNLETTGITSDGAILMELVDDNVYKYVDDEFENVCYIHGSAMACLPIK